MASRYHDGQRALQDRFDSRRLADRLDEVKLRARLDDTDRAFIAARDMFFLATVDPDGWPTCSYKGGDPGFVRVTDPETLVFPCYDGNGMFLSMGNVGASGKVGMLFLDFEHPRRLRVEGTATLEDRHPLLSAFPEAQFMVQVRIRYVYPNCPRYIHHYRLVERSKYVPHVGTPTPVPDWKRSDWARDVLPVGPPRHP
jgi:uncharacterized protein